MVYRKDSFWLPSKPEDPLSELLVDVFNAVLRLPILRECSLGGLALSGSPLSAAEGSTRLEQWRHIVDNPPDSLEDNLNWAPSRKTRTFAN